MNDSTYPLFAKSLGTRYSFYLTGPIGDAIDYVSLFEVLRDVGEDDQVFLHINTPGGNLDTTIQMLRCISDCNAPVIGSLEGIAHSAGSLIFLACDYYQISPYSSLMCHNYSTVSGGKGGELFDEISFMRKWSEHVMHEVYRGFLTESEIKQLLDSKDIWLDADEISRRLDKKIHLEQKLSKKKAKEQEMLLKSSTHQVA